MRLGTLQLSGDWDEDQATAIALRFRELEIAIDDITDPWVFCERYASINIAVAAIGATQTTLIISNEQTLMADLIIPSNIHLVILKGGSIIRASTYTLTINGPFKAGLYQVFSGFTLGVDLTFGGGVLKEFHSTWLNDDKHNVGFGMDSLRSLTTGYDNTGIGYQALAANVDGMWNVAIGYKALNVSASAYENTALGAQVLEKNTTGHDNVGLGYAVLYQNLVGYENVGIGVSALEGNTEGHNNVMGGFHAGIGITVGNNNTGFGDSCLNHCITGSGNVALGRLAGEWERQSNRLFIDNQTRSSDPDPAINEANARLYSLIYGVFDVAMANQALTFNAAVINLPYLPIYADNAAAWAAGLTAGRVYRTAIGVLMVVYTP